MDNLSRYKAALNPYFRIGKSARVGRFIIVDSGASYPSRHFHGTVLCSQITDLPGIAEVDIVEQGGVFYRAGDTSPIYECSQCGPLEQDGRDTVLFDTKEAACLGRDDEWVKPFRVRGKVRPPEWVADVQLECLGCPILEDCYAAALVERPAFGVMGGVRYNQIQAWGDQALEIVKGMVYEDQKENHPARDAGAGSGNDGRTTGGGGPEAPAGVAAGGTRGVSGRPHYTSDHLPVHEPVGGVV